MFDIILNTHLSDDTISHYMKNNNINDECVDIYIIFNKLSNRRYIQPINIDNHQFDEFHIRFDEICIGDIIKVSYCTNSQRYMLEDEYQSFIGKVFFIDIVNRNILFYNDKFDKQSGKFIKTITSLLRPYCSYFGDQSGYSIFMKKIILDI